MDRRVERADVDFASSLDKFPVTPAVKAEKSDFIVPKGVDRVCSPSFYLCPDDLREYVYARLARIST